MTAPRRGRGTRAWRKLRDQVVAEEPICWLRLDGCTIASTTADHVLTVHARPDLEMVRSNLRGACLHCNNVRNKKTVEEVLTPRTRSSWSL